MTVEKIIEETKVTEEAKAKEKEFMNNLTLALVDQYQKLASPKGLVKGPVLALYHLQNKEHILFADYARLVMKNLNEAGISESLNAALASKRDSIVTPMTTGINDVVGIKISNNEIKLESDASQSYSYLNEIVKNAIPQACLDSYIEMTEKPEPKFIIPATNFATYFLFYVEQEIAKRKDESLRLEYGPCDEHDSFDKNYSRFVANLEKQLQNKAVVQIDEGALRKEINTIPISKIYGKLYFNNSINLEQSQIRVEEDLECLVNDGILKDLAIKTRDHFLGLKKELKR